MIAIFDWDGTLCDSIEHIVGAMRDAAVEVALEPPTAAEVRNIVGLGLPEAVARLFPALDNGQHVALASAYSRHFSAPERGTARLFDGAMDTLQALRSRGIELAVATGKSRRGLNRVLAELGLGDFFEATRCADETRSKPHPLMVHEIMGDRGKSVDEVVVKARALKNTEASLLRNRQKAENPAIERAIHTVDELSREER